MNTLLSAVAAAALIILPLASSQAATIDPTDFDLIITEGKRTQTLDGADVSGVAWNNRNSDVKSLDIGRLGAGDTVLLIGGVGAGGADVYFATSVTGIVEVSILNFAQSPMFFSEANAFGAQFDLSTKATLEDSLTLVSRLDVFGQGSDLVENQSLAPVVGAGEIISLRILGLVGVTDFDIQINVRPEFVQLSAFSNVSAVPLPAGLPLMAGALAMVGLVNLRRNKKQR